MSFRPESSQAPALRRTILSAKHPKFDCKFARKDLGFQSRSQAEAMQDAREMVGKGHQLTDSHRNICGSCGAFEKTAKSMKSCSRCKAVFYCNPECQKAHWKAHKSECVAAT